MDLSPKNYIIKNHTVEKINIGDNRKSIIEHQVIFIPAINGIPVYTSDENNITIYFDVNGIVQMDYNWVELSYNPDVSNNSMATNAIKTEKDVLNTLKESNPDNEISIAYDLDSNFELTKTYEIIDDDGIVISRVNPKIDKNLQ